MNRCPVCHARLQTDDINLTTICCRCGSDLNLLFSIKQEAHYWLSMGCCHFISGNKQQALDDIRCSLDLADSTLARLLYIFIQQNKSEAVDNLLLELEPHVDKVNDMVE